MAFKLFKSYTLKWWQGSLFKWALLSFGLVIGSTWPELFAPWRVALLAVFVILSAYLTAVWVKQ